VATVDFDEISKYVEVPPNARRLLAEPERQMLLNLNIRSSKNELLVAKAFLVYHNTARGPAKGGIRISPDVTLEETTGLAERMTWKTALVKIPFGGGKTGIAIDPRQMSLFERNELLREFVHIINEELVHSAYIPAPDLGSHAADMAIIYGQTHMLECVTGKPPRVGGLPGREEATGRGVAFVTRLALERYLDKDVNGATVAIQGYGNVGGWTARFLHQWGARVVALSDVQAGVSDPNGLDIAAVDKHYGPEQSFDNVSGSAITNQQLLAAEADVLIPAAVGNVLNAATAPDVCARLIVEGANGPTTDDADAILHEADVTVVPDILANAGGVIASYIEWRNAKSGSMTHTEEVFESIEHILGESFEEVVDRTSQDRITPRLAAQVIAVDEVVSAMRDRGWI